MAATSSISRCSRRARWRRRRPGFRRRRSGASAALAINTAGNREEAVGFVVNGVTSNNLTFGSLMFEPAVGSIQEFKVDNSVFSAEYGHVSGAIVNIVTRSGTDELHGEAHGFLRNDALDARNFFEFTSPEPHPFERHQFGGSLGGPFIRGKGFFFATYDGLRQRQGLDMNSLVLSDEQRAAATDPVVRRLIELIPRANLVDAGGTPRFVGRGGGGRRHGSLDDRPSPEHRSQRPAPRILREAADPGDRAGLAGHADSRLRSGVAAAADARRPWTKRTCCGSTLLNEARFGRSGLLGGIRPRDAAQSRGLRHQKRGRPAASDCRRSSWQAASSSAGRQAFPRAGTTPRTSSPTRSATSSGRHSVRLGGEYRHFLNENFAEGTGSFNFPSVAAFLSGTANAFSITLGERRNHIDSAGAGLLRSGPHRCRFERSPSISDCATNGTSRRPSGTTSSSSSTRAARRLLRVGVDVDEIYRQNNRNLEPRLGVAWDASGDGRTVVRAAYGRAVDQPGTTAVQRHGGQSSVCDAARGRRRDIPRPARSRPRARRGSRRRPSTRGSGTRRCNRGT